MFWNISVINKGPRGPYLITFLEVRKMIQKVLQCLGVKINNFVIFRTPPKPQTYFKTPRKNTKSLKRVAIFWALLDPVLGCPYRQIDQGCHSDPSGGVETLKPLEMS